MFTGLVEYLGRVVALTGDALEVQADNDPSDWQIGGSVAVNGCCLTVVEAGPNLRFDLSAETLRRTAFSRLKLGSVVNLERPMRPSDRFDGHIVQGHVDATGHLIHAIEEGAGWIFRFQAPSEFDRYLIDKGSVAVEGISLTVIHPEGGAFDVAIIPHTYRHTNLSSLGAGDPVNLEFDLIARYVEKLLKA